MQHLLLAVSIILLTLIAGNKDREKRQQAVVRELEKEAPKKPVNPFSNDRVSVWYSRFDMIAN